MQLKGSPTAAGLRSAFTSEAEAAVRLLYFARRADIEGRADISSVLRAVAEGEMGQAFGHLELLEEAEDPITGGGDSVGNVVAFIASERETAETTYPDLARQARSDGFTDIADWFDSLATAEQSHAGQLNRFSPKPA